METNQITVARCCGCESTASALQVRRGEVVSAYRREPSADGHHLPAVLAESEASQQSDRDQGRSECKDQQVLFDLAAGWHGWRVGDATLQGRHHSDYDGGRSDCAERRRVSEASLAGHVTRPQEDEHGPKWKSLATFKAGGGGTMQYWNRGAQKQETKGVM